MPNILKRKIEDKLTDLGQMPNSLIVLKGIPMEAVFPDYAAMVDLDLLVSNKLRYFTNLVAERSVVTYEEFLLLYDFLVSQHSTVCV